MDTNAIKEQLEKILPKKNILENESMAKHTSFRCGGNAALFAIVDSVEELCAVLNVVRENKAKFFVLGNGSNTLCKDSGYDGIVIKLGKEFSEIIVNENEILVGSAASLPYLSKIACVNGLLGLEFACGIPASVGGATFMNAGAYDGCMKDIIVSVSAMNQDGEIYEYDKDELDFSYRHSRFEDSKEIILFVKLCLAKGDTKLIQEKMDELSKKRKEKQPLNYPSAGSFFKRPEGGFAAALIEQAGLKGYSFGGASVSSLHSGFIINENNASASDIQTLAQIVSNTVEKRFGVKLSPEVRIIG